MMETSTANIQLVPATDIWENIQGGFLDHLDEVNRDLAAAGLPLLEQHEPKAIEPSEEFVVNGVGKKEVSGIKDKETVSEVSVADTA